MKQFLLIFGISLILFSCKYDKGDEDIPEFELTFSAAGNQEANRLIAVDDGIVIVGSTEIANSKQAFIRKTDFNGTELWYKELSTGSEGFSLKVTSDNHLILCGSISDGIGDKNLFLAKIDLTGNTLWEKSFGGSVSDIGRDVIELQNGGFMLIGTTQSFGPGVAGMFVIRTDTDGNEIWSRTFGGEGVDGGSEVMQVNAFEMMLLGFTGSFGAGDRDLYLQSVSIDGDSLWSSTYGGAGYEESQSFQRTSDGWFVMSNHSASNEPNHSVLATRLDANGMVAWEHEFGTPTQHEGGEGMLADSEGNFVFLGRTNSFGNGEQVYFIKTDASGNVMEELNFGAEGDQRGSDIIETSGAYFISGTSVVDGDSDVLLIKRPM